MEDLKPTIKLKETKPTIKEFAITVSVPLDMPVISFKDINKFINYFSNHMDSKITNYQKQQYQKCIDILNSAIENKATLTKSENIFTESLNTSIEFTFSFTAIINLINFVNFLDKNVILYLI